MFIQVLKSKIHRVSVTEARLDYIGSITIDEDLLDAAGILAGERVYIVNNNNGARLDTYTIPGPRGSGVICLNGAAARLVQRGDNHELRLDDTGRSQGFQTQSHLPRYSHKQACETIIRKRFQNTE